MLRFFVCIPSQTGCWRPQPARDLPKCMLLPSGLCNGFDIFVGERASSGSQHTYPWCGWGLGHGLQDDRPRSSGLSVQVGEFVTLVILTLNILMNFASLCAWISLTTCRECSRFTSLAQRQTTHCHLVLYSISRRKRRTKKKASDDLPWQV